MTLSYNMHVWPWSVPMSDSSILVRGTLYIVFCSFIVKNTHWTKAASAYGGGIQSIRTHHCSLPPFTPTPRRAPAIPRSNGILDLDTPLRETSTLVPRTPGAAGHNQVDSPVRCLFGTPSHQSCHPITNSEDHHMSTWCTVSPAPNLRTWAHQFSLSPGPPQLHQQVHYLAQYGLS